MAAAVGAMGGYGSGLRSKSSRGSRVSCVGSSSSSSSVSDPYKTLKIRHGASESEVKKAFRRLALRYHPDVCRGSNCGTQFHQINEAYGIVMSQLKEKTNVPQEEYYDEGVDESDRWGEWIGWEAAWMPDYSARINEACI
ncbi:hypothetical protein DM860_010206 [Cuscuta australis]|uniref:J domain-containing protein n=1 Tax=Cuscuta australis TaxID=267555 RepID=A0A328D6C2_9ASTE|nr:hypothetical protein DM860_010206 [Cuscuta australis]